MDKSVQEIYGNRLRTRVSGLCWNGEKVLLINHQGLYGHAFWAPPGGGIEFGQAAASALVREFQEEAGVVIQVGEFQFACEFINPPLHAIELFFAVTAMAGLPRVGTDPEMGKSAQIIKEVKYFSVPEINSLPGEHKHGLFKFAKSIEKIRALKGYLKI